MIDNSEATHNVSQKNDIKLLVDIEWVYNSGFHSGSNGVFVER